MIPSIPSISFPFSIETFLERVSIGTSIPRRPSDRYSRQASIQSMEISIEISIRLAGVDPMSGWSCTRPSPFERARSASRAALCIVRKPPCFAVLRIEEGAGGSFASVCSFPCSKRVCRGLVTRVSWRGASCCALGGASFVDVRLVVGGWQQTTFTREGPRSTSGEVACTRTYV